MSARSEDRLMLDSNGYPCCCAPPGASVKRAYTGTLSADARLAAHPTRSLGVSMKTVREGLLGHHWVHSRRTHSLSRPGGLPTRARPEATNGHSTDLYTPNSPLRLAVEAFWHLHRDKVTRGRSSLSAHDLAFSVALLAQAHQ